MGLLLLNSQKDGKQMGFIHQGSLEEEIHIEIVASCYLEEGKREVEGVI